MQKTDCFIYIIHLYGKNAKEKVSSILHFLWHSGISVVTGIYFGIQPFCAILEYLHLILK